VEVKRSLRVLDGGVVVFDGVAGVEPQSETNWRYADEIMCLAFVSSINSTAWARSFERSFQSIFDRLNKNAVRMQFQSALKIKFEGVIDLLENESILV
jgi:elongation factor G